MGKRTSVVFVDNRGTVKIPFGWVELKDGTRVGFGAHRDDPNPLAIWLSKDSDPNMHPLTWDAIRIALAKAFPDVKEDVA